MWILVQSALIATAVVLAQHVLAGEPSPSPTATQEHQPLRKRINFISTVGKRRTPSPPGWEEYDGSIYTKERGYGWLSDFALSGWDGGGVGQMILPDDTRASPRALGRLELANWQGNHRENRPLVFRVDLPDGWYRVTCTSVDPDNAPLPLVDQRSIKFRAHDVVFAGPAYGAPLAIEGNRLVEGSGIVEVTEGHLRIVVGDPAYGGWTWSYNGPWYRGWRAWFGKWNLQRYAESWYQKLTRTVDPGFHSLRFNSLEIDQVAAPTAQSTLFFRDFFNRDDSPDINAGVARTHRWVKVTLKPSVPQDIRYDLYKTAIRLTSSAAGKRAIGLAQEKLTPPTGRIRYSTRVSLFIGEGSKIHSGSQEAGLLMLAESGGPSEFNSTFLGVAFDSDRPETQGWVRFRVGDGRNGYRTNLEIPDTLLPFKVTEGEYEVVIDHDVEENVLALVRINGVDITHLFSANDRKQRVARGAFGLRASMDSKNSGVHLEQFYWYYRVEVISRGIVGISSRSVAVLLR
jgi:hypothetical protein